MVRTREGDGNVVVATHGSGVYSGKISSSAPIDVDILNENFDSETFPPTGWSQDITVTDATWIKGNPDANNFSTIDPSNVYSAMCPWKAADQDELLYSPTLIFPSGEITLSFYVGYSTQWLTSATVALYITTDNGSIGIYYGKLKTMVLPGVGVK